MANKKLRYMITYAWKEDGNRDESKQYEEEVQATTVPRAISKLVRELQEVGDIEKASEILVIEVRHARR